MLSRLRSCVSDEFCRKKKSWNRPRTMKRPDEWKQNACRTTIVSGIRCSTTRGRRVPKSMATITGRRTTHTRVVAGQLEAIRMERMVWKKARGSTPFRPAFSSLLYNDGRPSTRSTHAHVRRALLPQETTENKRVLRDLVSRWNRPVYEKATRTNYGHNRSANDALEAMEVRPRGGARGAGSGSGMRQAMSGSSSQRDGPSRNEAVGNILSARAKGVDPTQSRVPFSNGYAFSKAPRSKVEGSGRAPAQQVTRRAVRDFCFC